MRLVSAILVLLIVSGDPASAQVYRCKVSKSVCAEGGCRRVTGWGSCVAIGWIGSDQYFLTAGHVTGARPITSEIYFRDQWHEARFHAQLFDKNSLDLALISIANCRLESFCLGSVEPRPGSTVWVGGFPGRGLEGRDRTGRVLRGYPRDLAVGIDAKKGESGGAILDGQRRLVGIISAGGPGFLVSTKTACLQIFVKRTLGRLPECGQPNSRRPPSAIPEKPSGPSNAEVLDRLNRLETKIDNLRIESGIQGPPGEPGRPGRDGKNGKDAVWDREVVRTWIHNEVQSAVSQIEPPRGEKGEKGEPGERGLPGKSYDPAELDALKQRIHALEQRPSPKARDITVRIKDGKTDQALAVPVSVPPDRSEVIIPIERFERE